MQADADVVKQDHANLQNLLKLLVGDYSEMYCCFDLRSDEDEVLAMAVMEKVCECDHSYPMKN